MIGFFAIFFTISLVNAPFADKPKNTSAFLIAWLDFHWFKFSLPLKITPVLSIIVIFFCGTPLFLNKFVQAIAEAPAPLTTIFTLLIDFLLISRALINAAVVIIAVPCWSSWKTGISKISFSFSSIIKQSGAAISSRFIPPKLGAKFFILFIISSGFDESISRSMESMSANRLNKTAFPSMTGFEAKAPKFPIPKIADPLLITATRFPLLV